MTERVVGAPIGGELALVGLGGTGRGEMAPYSDFDLMVLTAKAPTAEVRAAAEAILHLLWDLKLKVGHSVRSTSELIALAKKDMTIRTALLEGRWLWGDDKLFDAAMRRFRKEVVAGTAAEFVAAKLAERDAAPPPDGRQPLCRRAQRQGRQGRPSRPPHALLDRQICARRRTPRRPGRRRAC